MSAYQVELSDPVASRCECCGGLTVRLSRLVYREGDAHAVYWVRYAPSHPEHELKMLITLGEWGDDASTARVSFSCRVRINDGAYEVMLDDAADSGWNPSADIFGRMLTQAEARAHPWKADAFAVLDEAFVQDPSLRGVRQRSECGEASAPLETRFDAPDEVHAADAARSHVEGSFAVFDGQRYFVRALLELDVEHYTRWSAGVWVEVTRADYEHIRAVWDEPAYAQLVFTATLANDLVSQLDLPAPLGVEVELYVADVTQRPYIRKIGALASLSERWSRERFEQYALRRGYL